MAFRVLHSTSDEFNPDRGSTSPLRPPPAQRPSRQDPGVSSRAESGRHCSSALLRPWQPTRVTINSVTPVLQLEGVGKTYRRGDEQVNVLVDFDFTFSTSMFRTWPQPQSSLLSVATISVVHHCNLARLQRAIT